MIDTPLSVRASSAAEFEIRRMATEYAQAITAGDRKKFLGFFANDIIMMPPGQTSTRGGEGVAALTDQLFDQFTMREEFEYDELSVAGDWAAGRFTYSFSVTPKSGGPATTEFGKGMAWLRRTSAGSWQFTHMIWNLDQAAE
jgi:uncharacterized protein (TIGR02246 family)